MTEICNVAVGSRWRCTQSPCLYEWDDNTDSLSDEKLLLATDTVWVVKDLTYSFTGAPIHLELEDGCGEWIEVYEDTLRMCFEEIYNPIVRVVDDG